MVQVKMDTRDFDKSMAGMLKRSKNSKIAYKNISTRMHAATDRRFKNSVDPQGKAWQGLEQITIDQRRKGKRKGSPRPLLDTGALRNSIIDASTRTFAMVFTKKIYAQIHNSGGKAGRGRKVTIPQRQFMGISNKEHKRYNSLLNNYIVEGRV